MGLRAGVASDRGLVRPTNEDSFFLREGLYAVCDGMGGARGGEVASQMACLGLLGLNPETAGQRELYDAIDSANRAIVQRGTGEEHLMGMGTTLTAVLVKEGLMTLVHVGDSRAYLLRDGDLDQISEDHSWVGEMVRRGDLTPAQAAIHPHRNVITRVLGTEGDIQPDMIDQSVRPGDRILLCSDGLTGMVADTEILELLAGGEGPQETAEALVKAALAAGGEDNVTVVVIDVTSDEPGGKPTAEGSAPFSSQILFGPSDRGSLVAASSHRGRVGAGMRERFGRRSTPPARPVSRPAPRGSESDLGSGGQAMAETLSGAGAADVVAGGDETPPGESEPHTEAGITAGDDLEIEVPAGVASTVAGPSAHTPADAEQDAADASFEAGASGALAIPVVPPGVAVSPPERARRGSRLRPGRLKIFIAVLVVIVALAIAIGGFAYYNSTIYYVGTYNGTVALYRGLPSSVLGVDLSRVVQVGTVKYDTLTPYQQQKVDAHSLLSEEEAQGFLATLDESL